MILNNFVFRPKDVAVLILVGLFIYINLANKIDHNKIMLLDNDYFEFAIVLLITYFGLRNNRNLAFTLTLTLIILKIGFNNQKIINLENNLEEE